MFIGNTPTKIFTAVTLQPLCALELGVIVAWKIIFRSLSQCAHNSKGEDIKEASRMSLEAFLEIISLAGTGKHRQISQQRRCHVPFACSEKYKRTRENVQLYKQIGTLSQSSEALLILHSKYMSLQIWSPQKISYVFYALQRQANFHGRIFSQQSLPQLERRLSTQDIVKSPCTD